MVKRFMALAGVLLVAAAGAVFPGSPADGAEAADPPNIILCMADDHGWGDAGYQGHPFAHTPHLDRMAREGLRFDRWYAAAPVCSPTRGSCLTGRHPYRYGVYFANRGSLKREEICLAEVLQEQGYATGHFGKWHLGTLTTDVKDANRGGPGSEDIYSPPWENGFETCFSTESKVPTLNPMQNPPPVAREPKRGVRQGDFFGTRYWTGPGEEVPHDELLGDDSRLIMDRALSFIEDAVESDRPFLAVIWFHAPHTPVVADEAHRNLFPGHPHGRYGQHYHGCIAAMDEQIGRLRESLAGQGIDENTMLWYSSDNGPESSAETGAGSAGPYRGRKRSLYEGGIRVPGILVWPARIGQPRATSVPVVSSDYFPTILDVLDVELPDRPYDGVSLLPLIDANASAAASNAPRRTDSRVRPGTRRVDSSEGPQSVLRERSIGFQSGEQRALISQRYKLYSSDEGQTWELYDLIDDPGETTDLAARHPERVAGMAAAFDAWAASCRQSDAGEDYSS